MPRHGYLPGKDRELDTWSGNFTTGVQKYAQAWHVTDDELAQLQLCDQQFRMQLQLTATPEKNKIDVAKKNQARRELEITVQAIVNNRVNPNASNQQRLELGLKVKNYHKSPVPVPDSAPTLLLAVHDIRQVKAKFQPSNSESHAIPYGYAGAAVYYVITQQEPKNMDALSFYGLATKSPFILSFNEADRGKTIFVCLRWQNKKGQQGPWSQFRSAIIP